MKQATIQILLSFFAFCALVNGAERTWDGSVARDDDWSTAANWVGSVAPIAGDSLRFPAGASQLSNSNDYPAGTIFNAITYSGAGYTSRGSRVALSNGVSVTHVSGNTFIYLPITLRQDQTFTVAQPDANLLLNGEIELGDNTLNFAGDGDFTVLGNIDNDRLPFRSVVRKSGAGQLLFLQHLTYGSPTIVNGGSLRVDYSLSNSTVTVNSGATLLGLGLVEGLRVNSGGVMQPGAAVPDEFDVLRNAELNAGSIFRVRLNGTNAGSNYDQLRVGGDITLGGTLELIPGFVPIPGQKFTIIKNEGTNEVNGTFAGLPEGAEFTINGRPYKISYGGIRGGIGGGGFLRNDDVIIEAIPKLAIWDRGGGVNNLWSQPLNWVGDVIPFPGDDIQFSNTTFSMTTSNDFVGRIFGSLVLQREDHRIIGNPLQLEGQIHVISASEIDIFPSVMLRGGILNEGGILNLGSVTLTANQSFWLEKTTADLNISGLALNGHNLRVEGVSYGAKFSAVTGPGTLTKSGPGTLTIDGDVNCPVSVEEGTLTLTPDEASLTAPLIVKTGAVLRARGGFQDLEVQAGGTLVPLGSFQAFWGVPQIRLLSGSTLSIDIFIEENGEGDEYTRNTGFTTGEGDSIDISGCNLRLNIDPDADRTQAFEIIRPYNRVIGTFAGLPEGALFMVEDRVFSITYRGSEYENRVTVSPVTTFAWDGGGPGADWTTAANWTQNFAPTPQSHLIFGANTSKRAVVNDFPATMPFGTLRFDAPGYTISGNRFSVSDGLTCTFTGEGAILADLAVLGNSGINIAGSATLRVEGRLSGFGRKRGDGTLRLAGAGSNPGGLTVEAGLVELAKEGTNAISTVLAIEGGVVRLMDDDQISNFADVLVTGAGQLELNGQSDLVYNLSGDGTIELSQRFLRTGRLSVQEGSFSGKLTGPGTFVKTSPLLLTMTGSNSFAGTTMLEGGEMRMDGVQTNSTIRLDGGLLTGRGYVGPIFGNSGGTVAPGFGGSQYNSALHARDVTFNSSTTFRTVLTSSSPDFEGHKLQVAGSVNLGGSRLIVDIFSNFSPSNGAAWIIIENDGNDPIVGTFAGLPEGSLVTGEGLLFQISYVGGSGNDVALTRRQAPASTLASVQRLPNGQIRVQGLGIEGLRYNIHATPSLNPVIQWTHLGVVTAGVNGIYQIQTTGGGLPRRFYRAISP